MVLFINDQTGILIKVNELGKTIVGLLEWRSSHFPVIRSCLLRHFDLGLCEYIYDCNVMDIHTSF